MQLKIIKINILKMDKKLILFFLILQFTFGQNKPEIKILSGQKSQCTNGH